MSASFWSAVASRTRHRFGTRERLPDAVTISCARKRRRRCALPTHSKACGARAETSAWEREIGRQVHALYGVMPEEIKSVEETAK